MKQLALFIGILFTTVSCEKDAPALASPELTGHWQWVRTDGGLAAHIHESPASTGRSMALELLGNGRYRISVNGSATSEGTYTLTSATSIHDHTVKPVLDFSDASDMMIQKAEQDHLYLTDNAYDGVTVEYVRTDYGNAPSVH